MRRRLIAWVVFVTACASAGAPPGGPEDRIPPQVVRVTPDSNTVNVTSKVATFYFDDIINDRGTQQQEIHNYFLVSPSDGEPNVGYHRRRIDVSPRHGFRPNTAYTITMLPGLTDLRNNAMKNGRVVVFATGPTIPSINIKGVAFDWVQERGAPNALIEAITPDSSVRYIALADSVGRFTVGPMNAGTYLVRGIIDQNSNHTLDRNESYDTVRVVAPSTGLVELLAAPRDTLPSRIQSVTSMDSVTLKVTFDRLLDPAQSISVANFRLVGADSVVIPILAALSPHQEAERAKARSDSLMKFVADSARRADSVAGRPRAPAPAPAPTVTPQPAPGAPPAPPPPPTPSRPGPFTGLTLTLGRPLKVNSTYRLSVTTIRALSGRSTKSERAFTTPKPPPPPKDTTAAGATGVNAPGTRPAAGTRTPGSPTPTTPTPTIPPPNTPAPNTPTVPPPAVPLPKRP